MSQHGELRAIAVRHGELRTRRQRLERRDGLGGIAIGFDLSAQNPTQTRQPTKCVAFPQTRTARFPDFQSSTPRFDGALDLIGQIALVRDLFEQGCPFGRGELVRVVQRDLVLRGRFTVCTD